MHITKFQVFGQRCSGTNALIRLLEANFPNLAFCEATGFKHWLVPDTRIIPADTAVLVIAREIEQWLHSLYRKPWHAHPELKALGFSDFIRAEWRSIWDEDFWGVEQGDPRFGKPILEERCPETGRPFANVVAKRTAKLKNWIGVCSKASASLLVSQRQLIDDPEGIVRRFSELTNCKAESRFKSIGTYKGEGKSPFVPKRYPKLTSENRAFVARHICAATEGMFGFSPVGDG